MNEQCAACGADRWALVHSVAAGSHLFVEASIAKREAKMRHKWNPSGPPTWQGQTCARCGVLRVHSKKGGTQFFADREALAAKRVTFRRLCRPEPDRSLADCNAPLRSGGGGGK